MFEFLLKIAYIILMGLLRKRRDEVTALERRESLACRPVRNPEVSATPQASGDLLLHYPVRPRPWMRRIARRMGAAGDAVTVRKLQLDELGSVVWELMDGSRSVREVISAFAEAYQLHPREAEVSVTTFIRLLGKRGLVGIAPPDSPEEPPQNSR